MSASDQGPAGEREGAARSSEHRRVSIALKERIGSQNQDKNGNSFRITLRKRHTTHITITFIIIHTMLVSHWPLYDSALAVIALSPAAVTTSLERRKELFSELLARSPPFFLFPRLLWPSPPLPPGASDRLSGSEGRLLGGPRRLRTERTCAPKRLFFTHRLRLKGGEGEKGRKGDHGSNQGRTMKSQWREKERGSQTDRQTWHSSFIFCRHE